MQHYSLFALGRFLFLCGACFLTAASAHAQLSTTTTFEPADPARDYMDVGGAWNGTTDVSSSGDRFEISVLNTGATDDIFLTSLTASVPADFNEITNSLNVAVSGGACGAAPSITASRVGNDVNFNFGAAEYTLPASCTLTLDFGLVSDSAAVAGTYSVDVDAEAATVSGEAADLNDQSTAPFVLREGALVIEKTPAVTTAEVGDNVDWTITIRNSGLGGLFDVKLDETSLAGQEGLSLTALTPTAPVSPLATVVGDIATLGYLSPDSEFVATVSADVMACTGLTNTALTSERNNRANGSATASVKLDLKSPNVGFTVTTTNVPFDGTGTITVNFTNNGDGPANDFVLSTNLASAPLDVVSTSPGWSYSGGNVTKTGGPIPAGGTDSVVITVKDTGDVCTVANSASLTFLAEYEDDCGTAFSTPNTLASITFNQPPDIEVEGGAFPRLALNESGSYTLTLSANEETSLDDDPVIVTYTLPNAIIDGTVLTPSAGTTTCAGGCGAGDAVQWSVPRASLSSNQTLQVGVTTTGDSCQAGAVYSSPLNVSTSFASNVCPLADSDTAGFLLSANPFTAPQQTFNQTGSAFETGAPDDGDNIREEGEGEQAYFEAGYVFDGSDPGTWTGSSYSDGFGGLNQVVLNVSSLEYKLNAGAWTAVPSGSLTGGTGSFSFTMDFLASVDSSDSVAGDEFRVRYQLTAPDSVLGGAEFINRSQFNELVIASGLTNGASCPVGDTAVYRQGDRVQWRRALGEITVSLNDNIMDVCEVANATVSINNRSNEFGIRNVLARLNLGSDYELVLPSNPTFSGGLGGGANVTYNSTGPSFTLDDEKLLSGGTQTIQVRRKATATGPGGALSATLDYDDMQTAPAGARSFTASSSDAPVIVNQANLDVFVSPKDLPAIGSTVQWEITVRNTDSGTAFDTNLEDVVPAGLVVQAADISAMDAANPGTPVTHNSGTLTWSLGDIAPGGSQKITVQASFTGTTCSISNGPANQIRSSWGCGGFTAQSLSAARPELQFPTGNLQILHDTTGAYADLCGSGQIIVIVNNAGLAEVTDVEVAEQLNSALTGINYVPGSAQYSVNEGGSWSNVGALSAGSTLNFDKNNIPPLALLSGAGKPGSKVLIRFSITAGASANDDSGVSASGSGKLHCGDVVSSPGSNFDVPLDRPRLRVTKVGRNQTTGGTDGETIYAAPGDTVIWTVTVKNEGDLATQELRFRDLVAGTGGTVTVTGPGLNKTVTSLYEDIPQLGPNQTAVYTITETVGSTCVNNQNVADVTWGCTAEATPSGQASLISSPVDNTDGANLVMRPANANIAISQTVTGPGGTGALTTAGQVRITLANSGAPLTGAVIANALPTGFRYDPSFTPTVTNTDTANDAYNAVTVDASTVSAPEFTFLRSGQTGYLRHGKTLVLTFGIYQDGSLDTAGDPDVAEEDVGSSDPAVPVDSASNVTLTYTSGCGLAGSKSVSLPVAPKTPDLDVDVSSPTGAVFVSGTGDTQSYAITVTNNGETTADAGTLTIDLGTGWSGSTPAGCSGSIPGTLTCDLSGASALGTGASRTFTLNLTVANEAGTLDVAAEVTGDIQDSTNTNTGGQYSLDEIETQTLGFRQTFELLSTSEADFDGASALQIGEEATLRVSSVWFGAGTATIEDPTISINFARLSEMGYVSETVPTGQSIAGQSTLSGGSPNDIIYEFPDFTGGSTITVDLVTRVLNTVNTTAGKSFDFIANSSSVLAGNTFDSTTDGYTPIADRTETVSFHRPNVAAVKSVRLKGSGDPYGETATGDAGDVFEYQIVLTNSGDAPAFDLSIVDTVPDNFLVNAFSGDSIDNDNDGATDEAAEGGVIGQVITFDRTTTNEGKLASLPANSTLTLLYETKAQAGVNPNVNAVNSADYVYDSLNLATGSQTGATGANGASNGAFEDNGNVTATVMIVEVGLTKTLVTTSVGGDDSLDVVVGEQANFALSLTLPAGTTEDLIIEDILPEGLALFSRAAPSFGANVSCPIVTTTPATLPASGDPLTIQWDLGDCSVTPGTDADRLITLAYTTQVQNISAITNDADLTNEAEFTHSITTDPVAATPVTLTVKEPRLTLTQTISPNTNVDAGDDLIVVYTLSNTGAAPAFNVDILTLLNDNSVNDGADGDVNISAPYGDNLRDIEIFNCTVAPTDTSGALGDFAFSTVVDADNDADGNDLDSDCATLYRNVDTDGFPAGGNLIFSTRLRVDVGIVSDTDYLLSSETVGTSLPSTAPGFGDSDYERSASNDTSSSGRYSEDGSSTIVARTLPSSQKTFTETSDSNTAPDSGNAVDVAIGETYQAQITYRFDEGTTRRVELADRVRLDGPNIPADVELVRAQIARTSLGLSSETNPGTVNALPPGTFVDVTAEFTNAVSGTWERYALDMGDVTHSGDGGSMSLTQDIQSYIVLYDFRVKNTSENKDSLRLRDQGQTRRYNGENLSEGNRNGQTRYATIVEPSFVASKTSADADGILRGGETVSYTLTALNQGAGPAYNTVIEDVLPQALRANGLSGVTVLIDGAPPASAPIFSYNAATGIARWKFSNDDVVLPGDAITITYSATADAAIPGGTTHTNEFSVAAYFTQEEAQPNDRRQESRSNTASVTLGAPEIAFQPDNTETTQPGSTIVYPHILTIPSSMSAADLAFSSTSTQSLGWVVWYDADGNGQLSGGDQQWNNGANVPATGDLQFFVQAQVPQNAHDGWRDISTFTAQVSLGATVLTEQVTDITHVNALQAGTLTAGKFMAIDRNCDGSLAGESGADATFEQTKEAAPGQCVIYRITFTNSGTGNVSNVNVKDVTPAYTVYMNGSATYEITPAGLTPQTASTPAANQNGPLSFPYSGTMPSGETGAITYGVRVND